MALSTYCSITCVAHSAQLAAQRVEIAAWRSEGGFSAQLGVEALLDPSGDFRVVIQDLSHLLDTTMETPRHGFGEFGSQYKRNFNAV